MNLRIVFRGLRHRKKGMMKKMDIEMLKREWVSPARNKSALQAEIWDRAAENFADRPLPEFETDPFLKLVSRTVPLHRGLSVLDIGCGAGGYAVALAKWAGEVVGVDISSRMIDYAKQCAEKNHCANAAFSCLDWAYADIEKMGFEKRFDLVFAHMTPAVSDFETLRKLVACAKRDCFVQKPSRRRQRIQDQAIEAAGIQTGQSEDDGIAKLFQALWLAGFCPEVQYRNEVWEQERTLEDMKQWCVKRAQLRQELIGGQEEAIGSFLDSVSIDGMIHETVTTTIVTIYWQV